MTEQLTDAEIDEMLERFDQTEPKLQRRILAQFVAISERATDPESLWVVLMQCLAEIGFDRAVLLNRVDDELGGGVFARRLAVLLATKLKGPTT